MGLGKKILIGFIVCTIVLIGLAIFTFNNSEKFIASTALVDRTNKVLSEFGEILAANIDAETGNRGFVITGDEKYLDPYIDANKKVNEHLAIAKELTKDNPIQQKNIDELDKELKMRFDQLKTGNNLRRKDFESSKNFILSEEGRVLQDRIRETIDKARNIEYTLLAERKQTNVKDAVNFKIVFTILLLIILLVLIVGYNVIAENIKTLNLAELETAGKNWLLTGNAELNENLKGDQTLEELANNTIGFLCTYLNANIGAIYQYNEEEKVLQLSGQYAYSISQDTKVNFAHIEGLIGQSAREQKQISLSDLDESHLRITSALISAKPKHLLITPFTFKGKTVGVIEMGRLTEFNATENEFIKVSMDTIALSIISAIARQKIQELLQETQLQSEEKEKRAAELGLANVELAYQNDEKEKRAAELGIANVELAYQNEEKEKRAAELGIANVELAYQNDEKEKRAAELGIANVELAYQNDEKEKRANELGIANVELAYQNDEKEKRANELGIANKELAYQNDEKEKRATELGIANKELAYQNDEKEKRAAELVIANKELVYQNNEKEKRANELGIANKELAFQNDEKEKRAAELGVANIELAFQNEEKEKRAAELVIANKELLYQNEEKEKRANELGVANIELAFQNEEKERKAVELDIVNTELSAQAEELQVQQEELKQMNEELIDQAQNLKQQQEELQMTNDELEDQTQTLVLKNREVEAAKNDIELKTRQLEISSKYKSEFLANMSHELRTPLNSLLILSKDLSENRNKNLDEIQVESAEIIYKSGTDLLVLINEVLDLSKIEAGKMTINIETVNLKNFSNELIREFKHHAEQKGLKLIMTLDKTLPESIKTDQQRLNQILKNLLSNAIKFTEEGSVSIRIARNTENTLVISVTDTGIGIQTDKQTAIFEAFQQAEGGTSRKYGGTGLGLSISRELAKLLGAEIKLSSKINEGSTFSLIIPFELKEEIEAVSLSPIVEVGLFKPRNLNDTTYLNYPTILDDRENIASEDRTVLIIEDDQNFATILLRQAHDKGFKCLSAATGEDGLLMASKYKPQAIILDLTLPGINGHIVLFELKANSSVRHIPVHIISGESRTLKPIKEGAVEYLMKPVAKKDLEETFCRIENFIDRKMRNLLIVEDSETSRKAMRLLIGNGDVKCLEAGTGKKALDLYQQNQIDCIILDIGLPDMTGFEFISKMEHFKGHRMPPIIVYTGKELSKEENLELQKYADSIIIKGVKSEERLLDETALFLHRTIGNLPQAKQVIINSLYDKEAVFYAKKILLVDDDMRNLFALSKILKERGMEILKAENGKAALEMLDLHPDIDMVLMDIMMPEMNGYEAMKAIRAQERFRNLPLIALTAKAMREDKQKCIDAGANDYITKPIDVERLQSLMRVWLAQ